MELTVDSSTRTHFLIGDPIAQVIGPTLISQKMSNAGFNGVMLPLHVSETDLPAVLQGFNGIQNLDSVLITVPHKIACVSHCSSLSSRAESSASSTSCVGTLTAPGMATTLTARVSSKVGKPRQCRIGQKGLYGWRRRGRIVDRS